MKEMEDLDGLDFPFMSGDLAVQSRNSKITRSYKSE